MQICYNDRMSIHDISQKIKDFLLGRLNPVISEIKSGTEIKTDLFIALSLILIGLAGFGLGKLSAMEKGREPVRIQKAQFIPITSSTIKTLDLNVKTNEIAVPLSASALVAGENAKGLLVASKSGKKYHFPWCAGASQITEKNKIWFDSYEAAQKAGYTAASNCPNLK
jgi:hypothetical protein